MGQFNTTQLIFQARTLALDLAAASPGRVDADYIQYLNDALEFVLAFYGPWYEQIYGGVVEPDLTLNAEGAYQMVLNAQVTIANGGYAEIVWVGYEGSLAVPVYGVPLEPITHAELVRLREQSTVVGTPRYYSLSRDYNDGATTGTSGGPAWLLCIHPPVATGAKNFSIIYRSDGIPIVASGVGTAGSLPFFHEYLVIRLAAIEALRTIGVNNPSHWNTVAMFIPEQMRAARGIKLYTGVGVSSVDFEQ